MLAAAQRIAEGATGGGHQRHRPIRNGFDYQPLFCTVFQVAKAAFDHQILNPGVLFEKPQTGPIQEKPNRAGATAPKCTELEAFWMRTNLSMPAAAIIPVLEYPDVPAAVKWLEEAFAFEVRLRIGAHRAQLQFGGGAIVVSQSSLPDAAPGSRSVMVRVEAIDAHFLRARQHGARIIRDLEDFPYGERQYICLDPAGHSWTFSETVRNVDPVEWGGELVSSRPT